MQNTPHNIIHIYEDDKRCTGITYDPIWHASISCTWNMVIIHRPSSKNVVANLWYVAGSLGIYKNLGNGRKQINITATIIVTTSFANMKGSN